MTQLLSKLEVIRSTVEVEELAQIDIEWDGEVLHADFIQLNPDYSRLSKKGFYFILLKENQEIEVHGEQLFMKVFMNLWFHSSCVASLEGSFRLSGTMMALSSPDVVFQFQTEIRGGMKSKMSGSAEAVSSYQEGNSFSKLPTCPSTPNRTPRVLPHMATSSCKGASAGEIFNQEHSHLNFGYKRQSMSVFYSFLIN